MLLKSWKTFFFFLKAYPTRSVLMVAALTVAGMLEGLGTAALLPLIGILTQQTSTTDGGTIAKLVSQVFETLGLQTDIPSILVFIVAVMILKASITMIAIVQVAWSSAHVTADLRKSLLESLLRANWLHYVGLRSGASANAMGTEAQRAAQSFRQGCLSLSFLLQVLVYSGLAFALSWKITLAALAAGIVLVKILGLLTRVARKAGREQTEIFDRVLTMVTDCLLGAKPLKAMNKGENLAKMMQSDIKLLQSAQRRMDLSDQSIYVLAEPLMLIFVALGLYGALQYNALPLPELLFLAVLSLRLVMRVVAAQRAFQVMAAHESTLYAVKEKIRVAQDACEDTGGTALPTLNNAIVVQDAYYAYGDKLVLCGVSLNLSALLFHVISGTSGAGKTTLVDLIIGLIQPLRGDILIDGKPIATLDLKAWRKLVGYVPQDVLLFHDSIYQNIALNDIAITRDMVEAALKQAEAWDFVQAQSQGMDTVIGERGSKLSGGQRQRLALARAIVHHPKLLILDEATSALDHETEKAVLTTVRHLTKDMTVLAISHNQAVMDAADHVYFMQQGKIVERDQAA